MVFGWFWNRLADKMINIAMNKLQDPKLWKDTLNPMLDAVVDRQIARFQGKAGSVVKAAMPKFDANTLIGIFLQRFLGGAGLNPTQPQPINSSLPSEPIGT